MAITDLAHTALACADLDASIAFYRDVIGLPLRFAEHGYAELGEGDVRFALFERSRVAGLLRRSPGAPGPTSEVVWEVDDAALHAGRLRRLGLDVVGPVDRPWGHRTTHVLDPDGHVVELAERISRTRPRGPMVEPGRDRYSEDE